MLWLKAFHLFFVIAWFVGLFYLPRLFVYHVEVRNSSEHQRLCLMERRLYTMTTLGLTGTWLPGIATLLSAPAIYMNAGWLHAKLLLVIVLSGSPGWLKPDRKSVRRNSSN